MAKRETVQVAVVNPASRSFHLERKQGRSLEAISPLRYPGGKGKLACYIAATLRLNSLKPKLFVEPFAGGAAVSLYLLQAGLVERIGLAEKDPLLASFWKTVFYDHEWLIQKVRTTPVTLETWKELRAGVGRSRRDLAFACLFLNRTSFSGVLSRTAGPLGGWDQSSMYKIDCRYYPETIISRIRRIAALENSVQFVCEADWREVLALPGSLGYKPSELFFYLDPPFYHKAARLYRFCFNEADHRALRDELMRLEAHWLLSYDPADEILPLYSCNGSTPKRIELLYTASAKGPVVRAEELIISNLPRLPHTIGHLSALAGFAQARSPSGPSSRPTI